MRRFGGAMNKQSPVVVQFQAKQGLSRNLYLGSPVISTEGRNLLNVARISLSPATAGSFEMTVDGL
jgi:predicted Rdx family selenoprotein